ncbi:MAG TPA: tRNA lysidine(34) synthetase TilS [Chloroflexi bacterium]|nr:tRNA lysidine(34) synthetase TilS [Chloroflexota bacterium]
MDTLRQVRETIERHSLLQPGDTVVVGVSGGPDSLCLLHILRQLAPEYDVTLHVGHLNHGIRGAEADEDARYVEALCREWSLPCEIERVDVPDLARERGLAMEETSRQARYAFLGRLARSVSSRTVAVAHNADDQIETVLMHLLRGSGLAGLRGMRPISRMDELRLGNDGRLPPALALIRPLLEVPRADVEAYVREHDLHPRFDRSNLDTTYFRNRLRHELIPLLETYNPNVRAVLRRTAEVVAGDYDLLRDLVLDTWEWVVEEESDEAIVYNLAAWREQPVALQRSLLREGVHRLRASLRNINWVHIDDAVRVAQSGQTGAAATLPAGLLLTLSYDSAILADEGYTPPAKEVPVVAWDIPLAVPGTTPLPGGRWEVDIRRISRDDLPADWQRNPHRYRLYLDAARITGGIALRPRRPGDQIIPLGLGHRQAVRDVMINAKVPQAYRATLPLLVHRDDVVWIAGVRQDERYAITEDTREALIIELRRLSETE